MLRKTVSLLLTFSGVFVLLTSVVLYIEPEGRVAYWADWKLLGLDKPQWGDLHVTTGFLFLVALMLHVWLNWKPILSYMKNKARELTGINAANLTALAVTLYVVIGTLFALPPMQQVLELGSAIKDSHVETYGNPPYGHAELSTLERFAAFMKMDPEKALMALREKGFKAESSKMTLRDMADANGVTPKALYEAMSDATTPELPDIAPEGTGKLRLGDLCKQFGLDAQAAVKGLAATNIKASADQTMKEIASANNLSPTEVYQALRAWSLSRKPSSS
ncbi:DUF4405 domain-containing protein [Desulfovibrio sulfodismutans]|uniref:DUF4405 domain-containing protein n=1 Tax=Desulfolutivibrio sulfodismutans TaxID=63561 RepID=A0A7K3NSA5_9BACT|nr:DUF4405 domain-containing protein [Desulfolutivibrio sulfodismutans]NDY58997.1 DUF4405 domain-containing protein [Desulfolutivibrio sulfodismutans]QLA12641.1 DUF4405 domain-containing protein [Desulfolutivibrio sulfodismutans DSM 3696]